jgi:hypothetical protein
VLRVQGVRLVTGVRISAREVDALGRAASTTTVTRVPLAAWQLPSLRQVRVVVIPTGGEPTTTPLEPLPFDDEDSPDGGGPSAVGIPVPVVREVC